MIPHLTESLFYGRAAGRYEENGLTRNPAFFIAKNQLTGKLGFTAANSGEYFYEFIRRDVMLIIENIGNERLF